MPREKRREHRAHRSVVCHHDVEGEHREHDRDRRARTPVVGNANWIAYSVSTIPESIRLGASEESAAIAMSVVETVNTSSTVAGCRAVGSIRRRPPHEPTEVRRGRASTGPPRRRGRLRALGRAGDGGRARSRPRTPASRSPRADRLNEQVGTDPECRTGLLERIGEGIGDRPRRTTAGQCQHSHEQSPPLLARQSRDPGGDADDRRRLIRSSRVSAAGRTHKAQGGEARRSGRPGRAAQARRRTGRRRRGERGPRAVRGRG